MSRTIRIFEPFVDFGDSGYRYKKTEKDNFIGTLEYFASRWIEHKYFGLPITQVEFPPEVKAMPQMTQAIKFWRRLKLDAINGVVRYEPDWQDDEGNSISLEEYTKLNYPELTNKQESTKEL